MRILLLTDDDTSGQSLKLRAALRERGFEVDQARHAPQDADEAGRQPLAAVVLDLTADVPVPPPALPGVPVLALLPRDAAARRWGGDGWVADDTLFKPVDLDELNRRLRALARHRRPQASPSWRIGDLAVDGEARTATRAGRALALTPREFDLLLTLLRSQGRVLGRGQLAQMLRVRSYPRKSNAVEVHVHHLRRKLGPGLIETVRGLGYTLRPGAPDGCGKRSS
jgi:two-component system response regulator QseB